MNLIGKLRLLYILWEFLGMDWNSVRFRSHLWRRNGFNKKPQAKGKVLVEAQQVPSNQVALSIFLPILTKEYESSVTTYRMMEKRKLTKLKQNLRYFFSLLPRMGSTEFLFVPYIKHLRSEYGAELKNLCLQINSPSSLESFNYKGVPIGDLIYDRYLNLTQLPTLDFHDPRLVDCIDECIQYFNYWEEYFEQNRITALCVSHSVYHFAIPVRVAWKFNINVFQISAEAVFRLTNNSPHDFTTGIEYAQTFKQLPPNIKKLGKGEAKIRLESRLKGQISSDMPYMSTSPFQQSDDNERELIRKSNKLKVLIATHDFYDAPHGYGLGFYPDFYVWLERLHELSKLVNYDWYLKVHTEAPSRQISVISEFVATHPTFTLLPTETTHNQLLKQGIDIALTVHGTIGLEYPALGKAVVNASLNNPHAGYSFSITPADVAEYERMILNLQEVQNSINMDEIYEFYFMKHIYHLQTWIYRSYPKYLSDMDGYKNSMTSKAFGYFLSTTNKYDRHTLEKVVLRFLKSNDQRISPSHFQEN